MLREDHDAQAESPRVFGVVFGAATLRIDCLAENFLQLVALGDEGDLLGEALHGESEGGTTRDTKDTNTRWAMLERGRVTAGTHAG